MAHLLKGEFELLLTQRMNTDEQQLFVRSFKSYLEHGNNESAFIVCFDDVWQWLGFSTKASAKRLLENSFVEGEHYIVQTDTGRGIQGRSNQNLLMTVNTFKRFCLRAGTDRAETVQGYFIKMEGILHECMRAQLAEMCQKQLALKYQNEQVTADAKWAQHHALLAGYDNRRLVYAMHACDLPDGAFVVKIGFTKKLSNRVHHLSSEFGLRFRVMDVFPCERMQDFEDHLKHHPKFLAIKHTDAIGAKVSTEAYRVASPKAYQSLALIMQKDVKRYHDHGLEEKRLKVAELQAQAEIEKAKAQAACAQLSTDKLQLLADMAKHQAASAEHEALRAQALVELARLRPELVNITHVGQPLTVDLQQVTELAVPDTSSDVSPDASIEPAKEDEQTGDSNANTGVSIGPWVQLYDIHDLTRPVRTLDGITAATKQVDGSSYTQIKMAARNRTPYMGYRWFLVPRHDPQPDGPKDIGATVELQQPRKTGKVACLNKEKTRVTAVYPTQKDAAAALQQQPSIICIALKHQRLINNDCYVAHWDDVDADMQAEFLQANPLPPPAPSANGARVLRTCVATGLTQVIDSMTELRKKHNITTKTLKKHTESGEPYLGYTYKFMAT